MIRMLAMEFQTDPDKHDPDEFVSIKLGDLRKLEAELAALREQTRWIPIGERLPSIPFYDRYAVLCSGDYLVATFFAGTDEWRYRGQTIYGVSHWMTIPESPEVDSDDIDDHTFGSIWDTNETD
ncbi:MAG: hypothetical protein ACYC5K_02395 [Saccharofermentanales bacterium]